MTLSNSSNVFSFNIDTPNYFNIVGGGLKVGGTEIIAADGTFNTSLITLGGSGSNPISGSDIISASITSLMYCFCLHFAKATTKIMSFNCTPFFFSFPSLVKYCSNHRGSVPGNHTSR